MPHVFTIDGSGLGTVETKKMGALAGALSQGLSDQLKLGLAALGFAGTLVALWIASRRA